MSRGKKICIQSVSMATNEEPHKHLGLILTLNPERRLRWQGEATYVWKLRTKRQHRHFPVGHCVHTFQNVHFTLWIKNNSNISKNPRTPPPQIQGRHKKYHAVQWHKITSESLFLHWAPKAQLTFTSISATEETESSCSHPFPHHLLVLHLLFMFSY